nr:hypothetical protein [uncultured Tolumonas sp.]
MTTYIIDNESAGCDSMWSYSDGSRCSTLTLNKYLYVNSLLEDIEIQPCLILYSGAYEQLVLHQAFRLEQIELVHYQELVDSFKRLGRDSFSFVEISLPNWSIRSSYNETSNAGLLYSGTGGPHAFEHYSTHSNYSIYDAIDYAIQNDPYSDYEINHMEKSLVGLPINVQNFVEVDDLIYNNIYDHLTEIMKQLTPNGGSNTMKNNSFAGCTTTLGPEAPSISTPTLIEIERNRKSVISSGTGSNGAACMLNKKQIKKKKIVPSHGNKSVHIIR